MAIRSAASSQDAGEEKKSQNERSTAYPSSPLARVLQTVDQLHKALGSGPYDRDSIAKALGFKGVSGASASLIAALVHFGLLDRSGQNAYRLSELGHRYLMPVSDEEQGLAMCEAVMHPKLYSKLLKEYANRALPLMLPNILTRTYKISSKVAENAAQTFRESCETAGLLENGVIKDIPEEETPTDLKVGIQPRIPVLQGGKVAPKQMSVSSSSETIFPLVAGVKLVVPEDLKAAFAAGEFASEYKALRTKIEEWMSTVKKED